MSRKKIGLLFGAFDPIHDGHLGAAIKSKAILELDEVFFMVEKETWSNKKLAPLLHRNTMLKLAVKEDFKILNKLDTKFSIESTLPKIEAEFKNQDLFFIMGADVFMTMNRNNWPNLDRLLNHYIVVFERGNTHYPVIEKHAIEIGAKIAIIESNLPYHSSSDVKKSLHNKQLWLPKEVAKYIEVEGLYR